MNKQTKGIFIGIGLVTIIVSILSFISGEGFESFWGMLIGISLIVLAFYKKKPDEPKHKA